MLQTTTLVTMVIAGGHAAHGITIQHSITIDFLQQRPEFNTKTS